MPQHYDDARNHHLLPQGTWEDVNCEVRGQFMGHYLTALSYAWTNTRECGKRGSRFSTLGFKGFLEVIRRCHNTWVRS